MKINLWDGDKMAYYGITSSSQIIDLSAIKSGCKAMRSAAEDFTLCGNDVIEAGNLCTSKVLSFDNLSMDSLLVSLGTAIKDVESVIADYSYSIENLAQQIYNDQIIELAEYNRKMQELQEQQNN